jgi:hypothetical protein
MKYLVLALSLFALPVNALNIAEQGKGVSVSLAAGVPVRVYFPNKGGCAIVNFSGTSATKLSYVTLTYNGKTNAGPAAASRSVVSEAIAGGQIAVLVASADTVVNVTVYDFKPRTKIVGGRNGVAVTSCFA